MRAVREKHATKEPRHCVVDQNSLRMVLKLRCVKLYRRLVMKEEKNKSSKTQMQAIHDSSEHGKEKEVEREEQITERTAVK